MDDDAHPKPTGRRNRVCTSQDTSQCHPTPRPRPRALTATPTASFHKQRRVPNGRTQEELCGKAWLAAFASTKRLAQAISRPIAVLLLRSSTLELPPRCKQHKCVCIAPSPPSFPVHSPPAGSTTTTSLSIIMLLIPLPLLIHLIIYRAQASSCRCLTRMPG